MFYSSTVHIVPDTGALSYQTVQGYTIIATIHYYSTGKPLIYLSGKVEVFESFELWKPGSVTSSEITLARDVVFGGPADYVMCLDTHMRPLIDQEYKTTLETSKRAFNE